MPILQPNTTRIGSGTNAVSQGADIYALAGSGGAVGPTGPQGPAGATGPQGATGPAGTVPSDLNVNSVTASLLATTVGVNANSVQLDDAGIGFYENAYQYFSVDNNVPGGNTLRVYTFGVTPGVAMTIGEEGDISMNHDVTIAGALDGASASFVGTVQADTANVNNITAATDTIFMTASGGIVTGNDIIINSGGGLATAFIATDFTNPQNARVEFESCISDPVITTAKINPFNTAGVAPGGTASYVLNFSSDTPNNWVSGLYAVRCTMGVGGPSIPYFQGMFSKSPNNSFTQFNTFGVGMTLSLGVDGFDNTVLTFTNTSGAPWPSTSILSVTKIC